MAHYSKKQATEMIISVAGPHNVAPIDMLHTYLQKHPPEDNDLNKFDVLEINDDISDHFQVTDAVRYRIDQELSDTLVY